MKFYQKALCLAGLAFILFMSISATEAPRNEIGKEKYESIEKLVNAQKLAVQIQSLGSHQEECISLKVENTTSDTLRFLIEAGRRFTSLDTSFQDILIVKNKALKLNPFEQQLVSGYGFCCQSKKGSPKKESTFRLGYMESPEIIELANVIDKNHFPKGAIQSAIWVLSDGHPISSIHHADMNKIQLLRETVAKIQGIELPWYALTYEKDTSMLFSNRPERLIGNLKYHLKSNAVVSIVIRNKYGRLAATPLKESAPGRGVHLFNLDQVVKGWPKGEYEVLVYEDYSNLNLRKRFTL